MKLKLDENIGRRGLELLGTYGHDVSTVRAQGLGGASDERLFEICAKEQRVLVTLDRDFGQVVRFPPEKSAGIVILELGSALSSLSLLNRLKQMAVLFETEAVAGKLWIVEPSRVRIHLNDEE
ncbi:MAG TPA: DUF5615 family PIN-like protein [Stellaceae bacterium]